VPPSKLLASVAVAGLLLVAACGDDDDSSATTTTSVTTVTTEGAQSSGTAGAFSLDQVEVSGDVGVEADITLHDVQPPTELVTDDLVEGDGDEVPAGATVTVHYRGVLLDGTTFDASFGGQPVTFPLDRVIPGWTQGIPGMKIGGRRLLVIPPELAYGERGTPGGPIGPTEPLIFVVDMIDVAS
jgi:hypothetical protein